MAILNIQTSQPGELGVLPSYASINTTDTEGTVLTTGYLNQAVQNGASFSMPCIAKVSTKASASAQPQVGWYQVEHVGTDWSLVPNGSPGDVTLPTTLNHMAVYSNTTGTLYEDAATAINGGNLQAGLSGTAGTLASFPSTAAKGSLKIVGVASVGDTVTTISNASQGQATVYSIPDAGQTTAEFIISDFASTQHITSGGLDVDAGIISSGLAAGGFVGEFDAYPTTTASGVLSLKAAINATGDFDTVISNAVAVAQDQVISIPDSGAATASFMLSGSGGTQNITSGNLQVDAGFIASGLAGGGFVGLVEAFPTTAASGFIAMQGAINATGDFGTTISNSTAQAQAQVVTIPDSGAATSAFVLTSSSASAQSISSGLTITGSNNIQVLVGNVLAGSDANAGFFVSYPTTTANGRLLVTAVDAGGAFDTTISNGVMGQSSVYTIPDIEAATGGIVVSTSALRMKSVAAAADAGGSASVTITDAFCTAGSMVLAQFNTSANAVTVQKVTPGAGSFVMLCSGDPGASTVNYIITK